MDQVIDTARKLLWLESRVAATERAAKPVYKDYVRDKRNKGEKPLGKEEWEAKVLGKGQKQESKGDKQRKMVEQFKKSKEYGSALERDLAKHLDLLDNEDDVRDTFKELAKYGMPNEGHRESIQKAVKQVQGDLEDFEGDETDRNTLAKLERRLGDAYAALWPEARPLTKREKAPSKMPGFQLGNL